MSNQLLSERVAIAAVIDPDAYTAAAYTSDWVNMGDFEQVMAVVTAGTMGSSATIDAKLQQATDSSGTGAKDITGKAITQMTQASPSSSDTQALIDCRAEELDLANSFNYVAVVVTVAVATSDMGALVLGGNPRYLPVSGEDLSSVAEIVN